MSSIEKRANDDHAARLLRWLREGVVMAHDAHGYRSTPAQCIWQLVVEAVRVMDRQPDDERRWLSAGTRSGGWSMVGGSRKDARDLEKSRVLSAMKVADGSSVPASMGSEIDRCFDVMAWFRYCQRHRNPMALQRGALALARGNDSETVMRCFAPHRIKARPGTISYDIKLFLTTHILAGLSEDYGIVADREGVFVREYSNGPT